MRRPNQQEEKETYQAPAARIANVRGRITSHQLTCITELLEPASIGNHPLRRYLLVTTLFKSAKNRL
jgi:hypothetical protein